MMSKTESILVGAAIVCVVPATGFFAAWWSAALLFSERAVAVVALSGLGLGVVLDVLFLKRWIRSVYTLPAGVLLALYCFFSLVVFAICMGVPAMNVVLGFVAGAYVGRRQRHGNARREELRRAVRRLAAFTAGMIALVSLLSAAIALLSPSTPSDLQHMFQLDFEVTQSMILAIVAMGGSALVVLQYWLTSVAALGAYHFRLTT